MKKKYNYSLSSLLVVSGEMIEGHGEDSYSFGYTPGKGFIGVFDGCGGTGAKRYEAFDSHTGAFMSSRLSAYTAEKWWRENSYGCLDTQVLTDGIKEGMFKLKKRGETNPGVPQLKGKLSSKEFPTTAVIVTYDFSSSPVCKYIWAGDSRGYLLDSLGLSQITSDDIDSDGDAYNNIETDARVSNVINATEPFVLHEREIPLFGPCIVFSATDGCFSYYRTPMEFEHVLLRTLSLSKSLHDWELKLKNCLQKQASDDYTLVLFVFGFKRFKDIKRYYGERLKILNNFYINNLNSAVKNGDEAGIDSLWQQYRGAYYRYG